MHPAARRVRGVLVTHHDLSVRVITSGAVVVAPTSTYAPARECARDRAIQSLTSRGFKCKHVRDFDIEVTE